ncbi:MAG: fibrinogen-like YCDxxxxGGGW domain-containing protein [Proteobacteria bacterium]|nr:fibrinogen-like YCDxxxxGGGW domain-containing protein [Pseudomonadota bacterium]
MQTLQTFILVCCVSQGLLIACKDGTGPLAPESQTVFVESNDAKVLEQDVPILTVETKDIILSPQGSAGGPLESSQKLPGSSDSEGAATPRKPEPGPVVPAPPAPPPAPPPPFYPANCAEIKKAQPTAASGIFKIYLNAKLATRTELSASCDMSEDGGGWTLLMNYVHLGGTNPSLNIRLDDLPVLAGDTLGSDESAKPKNWGHAGNTLLSKFEPKELRFYCRSNQNTRIVHFKTQDTACLAAALSGLGSCANVSKNFMALTGHTGMLPAIADRAAVDQGNSALTYDVLSKAQASDDMSWSLQGSNDFDAWECDFGSNNSRSDTIHRMWFR